MCRKLGITQRVTVSISESPLPALPNSRGWVPAGSNSHFVIRRWVLIHLDETFLQYLITHELCHIALGHTTTPAPPPSPEGEFDVWEHQLEVDADNCVKRAVGKEKWKQFEAAIACANQKSLELKQKGMLPSR